MRKDRGLAMYRLFVAIELPTAVKQHLSLMLCGVPGARWTEPEQMHLTVRFIGEVDGGVMEDIMGALKAVRVDPFSVHLKGVGHFPPRQDPQTLWVGVEKSEGLSLLRGRVESALVRAGVPRERRKFHSHVRLAYLKNSKLSKVATYLSQHALLEVAPFDVTRFCLFSSQLGSKGAVHRPEAVYKLSTKGVVDA
jgi:RNA 2',3'-cyclic 3'-phosphodiesterase